MRPKITLWGQEDCSRCAIVKRWFLANGYEVEEKSAELAALSEEPVDVRNAVMADLQLQDGIFPLVYVGDKVFDISHVDSLIAVATRAEAVTAGEGSHV